MKTIKARIERLETAAQPEPEQLLVINDPHRPGHYVGGVYYPDLQAVEAAYPGHKIIMIHIQYEGEELSDL